MEETSSSNRGEPFLVWSLVVLANEVGAGYTAMRLPLTCSR